MATIEQSEKAIMAEGEVELMGSPTAIKRKSEASESELKSPVKKQLKESVEGTKDEDVIKDGVTAVVINNGDSNQLEGKCDPADSTSEAETIKNKETQTAREEGKEEANPVNEAAATETDENANDGDDKTEEIGQEADNQKDEDAKEDAAPELTKE